MASFTNDSEKKRNDGLALSQYNININNRTEELVREAELHPDEFVARSLDGTTEYAYAKTILELIAELERLQIDTSDVVIEEIQPPEISGTMH